MTLPASGQISLAQVRTELNASGQISLGQSTVRTLAGIASGQIDLNALHGKSASSGPGPVVISLYYASDEWYMTGSGDIGGTMDSWKIFNNDNNALLQQGGALNNSHATLNLGYWNNPGGNFRAEMVRNGQTKIQVFSGSWSAA